MHFVDIFIFAIFLSTCLFVGLKNCRMVRNIRQFSLGFKDLTSTALFFSILSTAVGSGTTLGVAEKAYMFGALMVVRQLSLPLLWYIRPLIIPLGIEQVSRCLTVGDIMGKFYGP